MDTNANTPQIFRDAPPEIPAAFLEHWRNVETDLFRLAFRLLGNRQDAEDALQEVAIRILNNFHQLRVIKIIDVPMIEIIDGNAAA